MEDLKNLHSKSKISISEINDFILQHPQWAETIIRNALESEMYSEFCLFCLNFEKCWEKLGTVKKVIALGCICNEFLNNEYSNVNRPKLQTYFKKIAELLNV